MKFLKFTKIFNIVILAIVIIFSNIQTTYAADNEALGPAAVLKITMRKVELCTGYQGGDFDDILTDAFCNDALVVGTGDQEIDIASVGAGLAAGSYGKPTLLPLGVTYTHLRVTMDRKFIIKTKDPINTGSASNDTNFCITKKTTDAMYGGGTGEAGKKYTHRVAINKEQTGTAEEMNLYFVNGKGSTDGNDYDDGADVPGRGLGNTYTQCYGNSCEQNNVNWQWGYNELASDLANVANEHIAMSIPRFSSNTDDMTLVYKLFKPYKITEIPPKLDIAFSTSETALAYEASNSRDSGTATASDGKCAFTIGKVFVKIEMKDAPRPLTRPGGGSWR